MKQIKLLKTLEHPKGNVEKGSVYNWNEDTGFYELRENGIVISTINEVGVDAFPKLFKRL